VIRLIAFNSISNPMSCSVPEKDFSKPPVSAINSYTVVHDCSLQKTDESPELPREKGIIISVNVDGDEITLSGAFRIDTPVPSSGQDGPLIIPIRLLLTGSEKAAPVVFTIDVGKSSVPNGKSQMAGYFSLSLPENPIVQTHSKKMVMYAFHKELVSAPCVFDNRRLK